MDGFLSKDGLKDEDGKNPSVTYSSHIKDARFHEESNLKQ